MPDCKIDRFLIIHRWAYVAKNNVQLPDEYNQINSDLAPFWGMEPARLQAIQRDWEGHVHSYTLGKSSPTGPFYIANETLPDDKHERRRLLDGAYRMVRLMKEVEEDLPLFRAVFSPHDNPNVFVTEEMRSRAVDAGKAGVRTFSHIFIFCSDYRLTDAFLQILISTGTQHRTP
jgi:hypothetical protein